jgi:hypothetical protein
MVYTSHSHVPGSNPRYRIVIPLSAEVPPEIPVTEIMADRLGLDGVIDLSKANAAAVFYLPSCDDLAIVQHFTGTVDGVPVDATQITEEGAALLAAIETKAQEAAAFRAAARASVGVSSDAQLIEKIRANLDLESILAARGYEKSGRNFRHPNSSSGCYGANIKALGGIERIFSHNATDPLHAANLPEWCEGVTAIDAFDVLAILDYGGDRTKALRELAERYKLSKSREMKALAGFLFKLVRQQASQEDIQAQAFEEGARLGLSTNEVCRVAQWVAGTARDKGAA